MDDMETAFRWLSALMNPNNEDGYDAAAAHDAWTRIRCVPHAHAQRLSAGRNDGCFQNGTNERSRRLSMQLALTTDEARLLLGHLTQHIAHMDSELVHTDKRELQRDLARELGDVRALTDRLRSLVDQEALPDIV
jgi:hypothetical protein